MKKSMIVTMLILCVFVLSTGTSQAAFIYGSIWENSTAQAINPSLGPSALAPTSTFYVDVPGDINFDSRIGGSASYEATYNEFLKNPVWTGTNIGGKKIDTSSGHGTFFQFTGFISVVNGASFIVTHDDGFWLKIGGTAFDSSTPTSPEDYTITWAGLTGIYPFVLNYGAYNSYPEVLVTRGATFVPEPMTMILLGLGLVGLAGVRRFRK
jgi:hypothetical protein